ncbi:MAG: dihydropteroate synthase [Phycisphaerales bacterium]
MTARPAKTWRVGPDDVRTLERPLVMGIVNATPDSFSDGGTHVNPDVAIDAGRAMLAAGADIIDVGGESTRPGAERVDADEQIRRTLPIVAGIARSIDHRPGGPLISIDTTLAAVAAAAVDAGAGIINDVSAGVDDPAVFTLAAERRCALVLMHRARRPEDDQYSDRYTDAPGYACVDADVAAWLAARISVAVNAGCDAEQLAVDPGFGFGKSVADNYALIAGTAVEALGRPVLHGSSRKSFIGAVTGRSEPRDRGAGSLAAALAHVDRGANLLRVHDVASMVDALAVREAVRAASRTEQTEAARLADRRRRPAAESS